MSRSAGQLSKFTVEARDGYLITYTLPSGTVAAPFVLDGPWWTEPQDELWSDSLRMNLNRMGRFTGYKYGVIFPIWFASLVLALPSVAALRVGRFTIRSALVGTTIVAALLGMVVVL